MAGKLLLLFVIFAAVIATIDNFLATPPQAALLLVLVFWLGIFHGSIAIVAAAELARGTWVNPLKRKLFAMIPLIFFATLLFLLLAPQWRIYPMHDSQRLWFNQYFFLARNALVLLLSFVLARQYARASIAARPEASRYAVCYLFSFVIAQSLVAFDWLMPLEYPWFSTIYGPYFFIESMYMGLALAGIFGLLLSAAGPGWFGKSTV